MVSSPSDSTFEPAVMEQVITVFFTKSVHIILESRSPYVSSRNYNAEPSISSRSSSSSLNIRPADEWFNLALRDCPAALENFDMWRQSNLEPFVVDIVLNRRKTVRDASCASPGGVFVRNLSSGRDEFGRRNRSEKIVERWIVQYESRSISQLGRESSYRGSKRGSRDAYHSSEFQIMYKKAYRRIIVLLRSLYTVVRLLPAYKLFRDLNASGQIHPFNLFHRISSFAEPFSREEDAEMSEHDFGPLDIFFGSLSLSVAYLKKLEDVSSGPSTPISAEFIMDYVGSPLVDPLKRLPSLTTAGKDGVGHCLKAPYTPPQIPSRSSSKLSFMDKFDDSDFILPFAGDDEVTNSCRVESANSKDRGAENLCPGESMPNRRSPVAAVGELVWMLRSAPPLRLDNSNTVRSMQVFKDKVSSQKTQQERIENKNEDGLEKVDSTLCLVVTASDLYKSRTAADAIKELETYKDIKELILKHGGFRVRDVEHIAKSNSGDPSAVE